MHTGYVMYCPSQTSQIKMQGNHLQQSYTQLVGTFTKCSPSGFKQCASDATWNSFVNNTLFTVFLPQNYINLNNHDDSTPITTIYRKIWAQQINLKYQQVFRVTLQQEQATFFDSFIYNILLTSSIFSFLNYESFEVLSRTRMP